MIVDRDYEYRSLPRPAWTEGPAAPRRTPFESTAAVRQQAMRRPRRSGWRPASQRLASLPGDRLYADNRWSLLLIFQAIDAAGATAHQARDARSSTRRGMRRSCLVQGVRPSEELGSRLHVADDQGAARARADRHLQSLLLRRSARRPRAPGAARARSGCRSAVVDQRIWKERFEDINGFERHLQRNGVRGPEVLSPLSKAEQKRRLLGGSTSRRRTGNSSWPTSAERQHVARSTRRPTRT